MKPAHVFNRFYCNKGKADALNEGFKLLKVVVITMDADLQDDPNEIKSLMDKINEGWDVVSDGNSIEKIH